MTDKELKKVFDSLASEENNLNDAELAISMIVALNIAKHHEVEKAKTVASER